MVVAGPSASVPVIAGAMVVGLLYFFPALLVLIGGMVLYFVGSLYLSFTASTSAPPEETLILMPVLTLGNMAIMFLSMVGRVAHRLARGWRVVAS